MRISRDNFSTNSIKLRLKDIIKVKDKKRGFKITFDMLDCGKYPEVASVSFVARYML